MRATINGKTYDTDTAEEQANYPTLSTDEKLFRTEDGEFFTLFCDTWVDGRRLSPDEEELAAYAEAGIDLNDLPSSRVVHNKKLTPLTHRQALEWCIKTQIPETLRGYLLECLP